MTATMMDADIARRFWRLVDRRDGPDACWRWLGTTDPRDRSGLFRLTGYNEPAHRVAWQIISGQRVPKGVRFLHRCGNRNCVNPAHLRRHGTSRDLTAEARFWELVDRPGEAPDTCWRFTGGIDKRDGTGVFTYRDAGGEWTQEYAHRYAWRLEHGPVPTDARLHQTCANRTCVRVTHLYLAGDPAADERRFWTKVDISLAESGACWEWSAAYYPDGYGIFSAGGENWRANRYAYLVSRGSIPEGKQILHHCDNPRCVRPTHLYAGTHTDNVRDRVERNRQPKITGERHHATKVTSEQVREITERYLAGETLAALGLEYGVAPKTVHNMVRRLTWADAGPGPDAALLRERGRARSRGARNSKARLTEEQVYKIRARSDSGVRSSTLAREYGVSANAIRLIALRHAWPYLPEAAPADDVGATMVAVQPELFDEPDATRALRSCRRSWSWVDWRD